MHQKYPELPNDDRICLYGILDGHGGRSIAEAVSQIFPDKLVSALTRSGKLKTTTKAVTKALEIAFAETESSVLQMAESSNCGCCAVIALIINNNVHVANLGDSKAVLCRQLKPSLTADEISKKIIVSNEDVAGSGAAGVHRGSSQHHSFPWTRGNIPPPIPAECVRLTIDHRPTLPPEKDRVIGCGGSVENGRIVAPPDSITGLQQSIGVARSFGDKYMKRWVWLCVSGRCQCVCV